MSAHLTEYDARGHVVDSARYQQGIPGEPDRLADRFGLHRPVARKLLARAIAWHRESGAQAYAFSLADRHFVLRQPATDALSPVYATPTGAYWYLGVGAAIAVRLAPSRSEWQIICRTDGNAWLATVQSRNVPADTDLAWLARMPGERAYGYNARLSRANLGEWLGSFKPAPIGGKHALPPARFALPFDMPMLAARYFDTEVFLLAYRPDRLRNLTKVTTRLWQTGTIVAQGERTIRGPLAGASVDDLADAFRQAA